MVIIKRIAIFIFGIIFVFALFISYHSIKDYKPDEVISLPINNNQVKAIEKDKELSMVTFNIGYAGLDSEQDFFADGGKMSRASSRVKVVENLTSIIDTIDGINPDFLLLQEVDIKSNRSYEINQMSYFSEKYPNYGFTSGVNYKVGWVPVPIFRPMGGVYSGIITFSRFFGIESHRYQLPGEEKWPVQLFELDRCFIENRYLIDDESELVVINLHLSAFDEGGYIRQQQLRYLKNHLEIERKKGNYIVVGGDWNHNLPGTDPYIFKAEEDWPFWLKDLPEDFQIDGFNWAVDKYHPTVRTLAQKYTKGFNFISVIDGFLVSDNVEIQSVNTMDIKFANSDHNPVILNFKLN